MKKLSLTAAFLVFLCAFFIVVTIPPERVRGATLYVGGTGGGNYSTIWSAIIDAGTGDTIFVYDEGSPYFESIIVPKPVTIVGENWETTIIDGEGASEVIWLASDWANISGFTVTNGSDGVKIGGTSNNNVSGNKIVSNTWGGVYIPTSSSNIWVVGNEISGSYNGITVSSSGNHIEGNYIIDNDLGVYLSSSSNNEVIGNVFDGNDRGIYVYQSADDNLIVGNTFLYYWEYSIRIWFSSSNRIYHNNFGFPLGLAEDTMDDNYWNDTYPSGGNYWRHHRDKCEDLYDGPITPQTSGSPDGICDDPYNIDPGAKDYYPLKYPVGGPSAPQNPAAVAGNQEVALSWHIPADEGDSPITDYKIYRGTAPGQETPLLDVGNMLEYTDTGLTNGETYYYKVSARNIMGEGPLSEEVFATPATVPPSAPQDLIASVGDSYINITWSAPASDGGSSVTNYSIHRGASPGGESFLVEIGNVLFYNDTDVTNGVTYYYQVSAKNVLGEGPKSEEIGATPLNQRPICAIVSPTGQETISGTYTLSGTASDNDGAIVSVEIRMDDDAWWTEASGTESWSFDLDTTTLSNGDHTVFARSYDGEDYSATENITFTVENAGTEESIFEQAWIWILVVVIVVVIAALLLAMRRKKNLPMGEEVETQYPDEE